jgi:phosphoribosylglycinamide formyltransferase-1
MTTPPENPLQKARVAVLISGRGSNMEALVEASRADPAYPARMVLVATDRPNPPGVALAQSLGLPVARLVKEDYLKRFPSTAEGRAKAGYAFEADLDRQLSIHRVDMVALAGFMTILSGQFVRRWPGLNIHPSLLPAYPGRDTHARVLRDGQRTTGCTVHRLTQVTDGGPILAQSTVQVMDDDTPETLAARVLEAEHKLYPKALADFVLATPGLTR